MDPLQALYATQEEIPEAFRPLFEEKGGQYHLTKIVGLKTDADISRVQRALDAEKGQHADIKKRWGSFFGDKKPEDIQAILDRVPELETAAAGKLDEAAIEKIVDTRTKAKLSPLERQMAQANEALVEAGKKIEGYETREKTRTIHDAVREVAAKSKIIPTAIEDMLMLAERAFEVNEDGTVTVRENGGATQGIDPSVWLTEMQAKRPHWWPASAGGGAAGGGGGPGGNNPFSAANWNLTEQGKVVRENPARAAQLAQSAGTTVGGPKPVAAK